ncbi:hypothetical protein [Embleya sp. NPDC059237]|uniref:hypothetical protein n=1 Tax=Embleya sp. NPDC059237 TaxID=3346784 RepID=UPI0036A4A240
MRRHRVARRQMRSDVPNSTLVGFITDDRDSAIISFLGVGGLGVVADGNGDGNGNGSGEGDVSFALSEKSEVFEPNTPI